MSSWVSLGGVHPPSNQVSISSWTRQSIGTFLGYMPLKVRGIFIGFSFVNKRPCVSLSRFVCHWFRRSLSFLRSTISFRVSNDDFIPMTNRLRTTLLNRRKSVDGEYVFPGRFGGHKTIQNNRALEAAFRRAGVTDVSSHNLRKTFATRLLSRGAAITDVQHLLGHASVKTTEKAYAAFVKNERFKQTIDLLDHRWCRVWRLLGDVAR